MAKKALIILAEGFEEIEATAPIDLLRRAEVEVTVAGLGVLKVKSARNVMIVADKTLNETQADFDALILPGGGEGAKNLAASEKVKSLIKEMNQKEKLVAAICASPAVVLMPTGILKNKSATCYPGMEKNFDSSTEFKEESVVVDGNIITSRGPGTALLFALAIVEKLCGREVSEKLKKDTLAR